MNEPNYRFKSNGKHWNLYFPEEEYAIAHARQHNAECYFLFMDCEMPVYTRQELAPGFFSMKRHSIGAI
jgi:hypothetical protein